MITILNTCNVNTGDNFHEYVGKSADTKPTADVPNGSTFYEMDTSTLYMFDKDAGVWLVQ